MSDELLPYYNRELAFLRRLGAEFAQAHPKIAGRLSLGPDVAEDPHVERLIEAAAYLNARTRLKLEDDFPEITDALLGVLYPHYQAPIPSMAVAQFVLDRGQGELTTGYAIPREAALETEPVDGEPCRFRTCYPTTLWPVDLVSASLTSRPFTAPEGVLASRAAAVLRLELRCYSREMAFRKLDLRQLRFFLRGQPQHVFAMYELLLNNALGVALANSPGDRQAAWLKPQCFQEVGFGPDEGMLPYSPRSFQGYRLLSELFAFPQKFLFLDLAGLEPQVLSGAGNRLEMYIYLDRSTVDLEQNVTADMFLLGCAPVVNLYRQQAEPIALTHQTSEYRVVPDARRPAAHEVYAVERVTAVSPDNEQVEYRPFYSFKHARDVREQKRFFHARRQAAPAAAGRADYGTEVYLSLVDLGFAPAAPAEWVLGVETTCLNRDLPHRLSLSEGQSVFRLTQGGPVAAINSVSGRPTATLRPALKHGAMWKLVSHLSLNHLSLTDAEEGADALREILSLYDFTASAETRSMIGGISSVRCQRVVGRSGGPGGGFCRGIEVALHLDEDRFAGSGVYLFAAVLERFLSLYASINSFSKLIVTTNRREGELRQWPTRRGEAILL